MFVVCVSIVVKPESLDSFIAATLDNASNTRKEPNNVRFDVIQSEEDPTHLMLYEVYQSKADFAAHQTTAHYLRWKAAVAPWMARPRSATKNHTIFFGDQAEA